MSRHLTNPKVLEAFIDAYHPQPEVREVVVPVWMYVRLACVAIALGVAMLNLMPNVGG